MIEYSPQVKREAVTHYLETRDYKQTIAEIERRYNVRVSVRSIQYWMKRREFHTQTDRDGNLVLFDESVTLNMAPKQVIDKDKFLKLYGKLFDETNKEITKIQKTVLRLFGKSDDVEKELKELDITERVRLLVMLSKLKRDEFVFVLDALGRTDDEGVESIGDLISQIEGGIPSGEEK